MKSTKFQIPSFTFWANVIKSKERHKISTRTKLDLDLIKNPLSYLNVVIKPLFFFLFPNLFLMQIFAQAWVKKPQTFCKSLKNPLQSEQSMEHQQKFFRKMIENFSHACFASPLQISCFSKQIFSA